MSAPRWGTGFTVALAAHGALAASMVAWSVSVPQAAPPPAAMLIELAPAPVVAPAIPTEAPPKLETVEKPKPVPKPPPPKKADVALKPPPEPPRQEESSAPPSVAAPPAEVAAAPAEGASVAPPSPQTVATWQGTLLAHLERHKRYPRAAQARRQQGVVYVAFTIDREGRVVTRRLHRSSGQGLLDEESLDLLLRAQPLPPPPPDIRGDTIDLVVPVQFFLR